MFWWGKKKDISALPRLRKSWVTPLKSASKSAPAARRCAMLVIVEWKAVAFCSLLQINRICLATGSWPAWRVSAPIGLQLSQAGGEETDQLLQNLFFFISLSSNFVLSQSQQEIPASFLSFAQYRYAVLRIRIILIRIRIRIQNVKKFVPDPDPG